MTLQTCIECKQEVSDKAEVCIHCGNPLKSNHKVQEIEVTGKKYKKNAVILIILIIISFILLMNQQWGIGIFLFVISFIAAIVNNIQRWWNNG